MELNKRLAAFEKLGVFLAEHTSGQSKTLTQEDEIFEKLIVQVRIHNPWFTENNVRLALKGISLGLEKHNLTTWIKPYSEGLTGTGAKKRVLVIMAGNIPMVGFQDFLNVLISGNCFVGKVSSDDHLLIPFLAALLLQFEPGFADRIEFSDGRVKDMEAVIATGSTNSSRYFDYYFGKYPHIIRKNRHSLAILNGTETAEDFGALGTDIFTYYGLGCRNVSKLLVPEGYRFDSFFEGIFNHSYVLDSNKYSNNYEYNKTIYLLNSEKLLDNNFLLLREDTSLSSPIGVMFYEYYTDEQDLKARLVRDASEIQCIVSKEGAFSGSQPFGKSQFPMLWDYADGIDTMQFLAAL
jgi:hypothetical protein